jgi:hypothetical protein
VTWPQTIDAFGRCWILSFHGASSATYENDDVDGTITIGTVNGEFVSSIGGRDTAGLKASLHSLETVWSAAMVANAPTSDPFGIHFLCDNLSAIDKYRSDGETHAETQDRVNNILKYHASEYGKFKKFWHWIGVL